MDASRMVRVEPRNGMLVRDPLTGEALPAEGVLVERSMHWVRRVLDGSVLMSPAPVDEVAAENEEFPQ